MRSSREPSPAFERSIRAAAADRRAGAAEIAERVALAVARAGRALARRDALSAVARVSRAQVAMAPLWNLRERLRRAPAGRLADAARGFARALRRGRREAIRAGAGLVRAGDLVATISYASTVVAALAAAHRRGKRFRVRVSASRGHGRHAARALRRAGVPAIVLPDRAFLESLGEADLLLLGADAVTPRTLVNAAGTRAAAARARRLGIPLLVLADPTKRIPAAPAGAARDPRFDRTPIEWVRVVPRPGAAARKRTGRRR